MKKVLLVAFVAGLAMTSCKKEWTCECKVTTTVMGVASTPTVSSGKTEKMKKSEAKDKCKDTTIGDAQNNVKTEDCKIK